ncbi:DUF1830 domain-containing protein [Geitlerinema splendidum]|nr:DUF1830 domain-containing protein [Geitlerinema splendidum]
MLHLKGKAMIDVCINLESDRQFTDPICHKILCYYTNPTQHIQILRIANIPGWHYEKVAFPQQSLMFEAFSEAILEIHSGTPATSIICDKIRCRLLRVEEGSEIY